MDTRRALVMIVILGTLAGCATMGGNGEPRVDLSECVIVAPDAEEGSLVAKAVALLQEEVAARTGIELEHVDKMPAGQRAIMVRTSKVGDGGGKDGYRIRVHDPGRLEAVVYVMGYDDRGTLFAVGRLLRLLHMSEGRLEIVRDTHINTVPSVPIRGHQLGFRALPNTYDAWDVDQYEAYVRDMVVFGANAVELNTELDPERVESPHMKEPAWDVNNKLADMIASYGLDVWFWMSLTEGDVAEPAIAARELARRRAFFEACPHIDAIFVPGGDPGDTAVEVLMPWLARLADELHAVHPEANLWLSNQGFEHEENAYLFNYLRTERPEWLKGLVYGPWAKLTLRDMRRSTPSQYPLRRYPDITHNVRCQYPVPEWDRAYAHTLGREATNPRPRDMVDIHNALAHSANGFIAYSEGVHDDVNKFIWLAVGWDPTTPIEDILREYGRYFFGDEAADAAADAVADGLLMLEQNWRGPLAENEQVEKTLSHWQALEAKYTDKVLSPWRFEQCLLRAYYDAYLQRRLVGEMDREARAYEALRTADTVGVDAAVGQALLILAEADGAMPCSELRGRIEELGDALFEHIGLQLSVPRHQADGPERGAVLDFLDQPLNDRAWIEQELDALSREPDEQAQLRRIERIANWEDPGPGGFYDDLGRGGAQAHLVRQRPWIEDPGRVVSPQEEFDWQVPGRLSWLDQAQTLYGTPLRMRYADLDKDAEYRLRVVYTGRFNATMQLVANDTIEIHGPVKGPQPPAPLEFAVPREATRLGILDLEWQLVEGRGCQVAEVWLMQK